MKERRATDSERESMGRINTPAGGIEDMNVITEWYECQEAVGQVQLGPAASAEPSEGLGEGPSAGPSLG